MLGLASKGVLRRPLVSAKIVGMFVGMSGDTNKADTNMPLTDIEIRAAKPSARLVKLSDGGGLQLWIMPDGAKRWRFAYQARGPSKVARDRRLPGDRASRSARAAGRAKRLLADGQDPAIVKKLAKAVKAAVNANTFEAIAAELLDKKRREAKAEQTLSKLEWLLSFARPAIGPRPIAEITAPEVLAVLRGVESRGRMKPLAGFARPSARFSASPSPRAAPKTTRPGRSRAL